MIDLIQTRNSLNPSSTVPHNTTPGQVRVSVESNLISNLDILCLSAVISPHFSPPCRFLEKNTLISSQFLFLSKEHHSLWWNLCR